jgi:predicted amidohydrolase
MMNDPSYKTQDHHHQARAPTVRGEVILPGTAGTETETGTGTAGNAVIIDPVSPPTSSFPSILISKLFSNSSSIAMDNT